MAFSSLPTYQEDYVKDRETLENVGKCRLEVKLTPGEYRHKEDVAWTHKLISELSILPQFTD